MADMVEPAVTAQPHTDRGRPLSPHLLIWRWTLPMAMSVLHRATGMALIVGAFFLTWWLLALVGTEAAFATVQGFFASIVGQIFIAGWIFSLWYHTANGIRHLVWDHGKAATIPGIFQTAYLTLGATVVLTAATLIALAR